MRISDWSSDVCSSDLVAFTGATSVATVTLWQALLLPALVFAVPCALGAATGAWAAGVGLAGRLHERVESAPGGWSVVPGLLVRGGAIAVAGMVGVGALVLGVPALLRGGQVVALFEAGPVHSAGAPVVPLAPLAYLPPPAGGGAA